jgi:hypothetical protein
MHSQKTNPTEAIPNDWASKAPKGAGWKWRAQWTLSGSEDEQYFVEYVRLKAAPPVPDPRREAILEVVKRMAGENNGPRFLQTSEQWTDNLISAIDSLKGTK